jgi:hypothetical protein
MNDLLAITGIVVVGTVAAGAMTVLIFFGSLHLVPYLIWP